MRLKNRVKILEEQVKGLIDLVEPLVMEKCQKDMKDATDKLCELFSQLFEEQKKQRPKSRVKKTAQPETKEKRGRGRPRKENK